MDLLAEMNAEGRTVVVITHDAEVAARCKKIIRLRDGQVSEIVENVKAVPKVAAKTTAPIKVSRKSWVPSFKSYARLISLTLPIATENLKRNKVRTALTMLGIIIGIASVLSMVTLGQFTKRRVLDSYADLGVNTLLFYGYPNFQQKATDVVKTAFRSFDMVSDVERLPSIFDDIIKIAPILKDWETVQASFAGKRVDDDVRLTGTTADGIEISKREILIGNTFSPFHIEQKSSVCLIGYELAEKLFSDIYPLGQVLYITKNETSIGCKVIGVLKSVTSNQEFNKPNLQIILPYTYFQATSDNWWNSQVHDLLIQVDPDIDIAKYGESIKGFFELRYGKSGRFSVDSNTVLIAQMERFLNMFTGLLAFIAFMSLVIGGVGIANMMLVSVSERYREIGLRKAIGATDFSVRVQFLTESLVICLFAGLIGLTIGFVLYEV
ncbi:MAG: ABC transporter permease, partial [Bdellovibrionota bacterium]